MEPSMNTPTQNLPVVHVGNTDIAVIAYKGQRVILTELLAQVLGTEEINIQKNYNRNQNRFEEGKHCFKLEGDELTTFKVVSSTQHEISKHTRNLMLWTERGAARHAKFLDTDEAWDKFDLLESAYFDAEPEREAKDPRAKMEAKLINFLEGKPLGVSTTVLGDECFQKHAPLPLEEVLDGLVAAGVLAREEVPRVDGNPGRPTRLWRLSNLTLARLPDPASKLERCKVFIAELVALGPVAATEAMAACVNAGFSGRTIDRARKALALPAYQKQEGGWVWQKPEGEGNTWLTLTPRDLDALVRRAARGMGLTPRKAAPVPVACNPPTEAAALAALALQRMVVGFGPDGRMNAQLLREDEYIMTLDDFAYTQEKFLEQHGLAIVPKCLLDAARAMQAALGD